MPEYAPAVGSRVTFVDGDGVEHDALVLVGQFLPRDWDPDNPDPVADPHSHLNLMWVDGRHADAHGGRPLAETSVPHESKAEGSIRRWRLPAA